MATRKIRTNITLNPKVKAEAMAYCKENDMTLSSLIRQLLRENLAKHKKTLADSLHFAKKKINRTIRSIEQKKREAEKRYENSPS